MKDLIKDIIKLDQEAQSEIESLKKEKEELSKSFRELRVNLTKENEEQVSLEIQTMEEDIKQAYTKSLESIQSNHELVLKTIENTFNQSKDKWLDELFESIIDLGER